jgi:hypothetical protein
MWWCYKEEGYVAFFSMFEKKKKTKTFVTYFDGFIAKIGNGNNVVAFFYGGGVVKKAMVVGWQQVDAFFLFPFSFFFSPFGLVH